MSKALKELGLPHIYVKDCGAPTIHRGVYYTIQNLGFPEVTEEEWLKMFDEAIARASKNEDAVFDDWFIEGDIAP